MAFGPSIILNKKFKNKNRIKLFEEVKNQYYIKNKHNFINYLRIKII